VLEGACAKIHQAATEAKQYGGQAGRSEGQGFSVRHIDIPEIVSRLFHAGDS
jgi:hypothetical protein